MREAKAGRRTTARRDEEQAFILGDGMIARIADRAFENPAMSGGLLVMGLTAAAIISNAMFLQNIRHPDPIFSTRPAEHAVVSKAPAVVPIPRSRADHVISPTPIPRPAPIPDAAPDPAPDTALVAGLQKALLAKGLYRGAVDGKFGAQTRTAIAAFQRGEGLKVTGEPSAELLTRAKEPAAPAPKPPASVPEKATAQPAPVPAPDPAIAIEQARYRSVQTALNSIGYGPVTVDGHAGDQTADAIRRFELDNGLPLEGTPSDRVIARLVKIGAMPPT